MRNILLLSMAIYISITTVADHKGNQFSLDLLTDSITLHKTDIMKMDRAFERHMHKVKHDTLAMEIQFKMLLNSM